MRQGCPETFLGAGIATADAGDDAYLACIADRVTLRLPGMALDYQGAAPPIGIRQRNQEASVLRGERVEPGHRHMADAGVDDNHIRRAIRTEGEPIGDDDRSLRPRGCQIMPCAFGEAGIDLDRRYLASRSDNFR